jgi:rubrerythrin
MEIMSEDDSDNKGEADFEGDPKKKSQKKDLGHLVTALTSPPPVDVKEEFAEEILYDYECPSCGASLSENMTKCPTCGVEFLIEEEIIQGDVYECPSCHAYVTSEMTDCPGCDARFELEDGGGKKYECPICGASVKAAMTNCPICEVHLRSFIKFPDSE